MANNLIELVIRSIVEGTQDIESLQSTLGALSKSSEDNAESLLAVGKSADQASKSADHFKEVLAGIGEGLAAELNDVQTALSGVRAQLEQTGQSTENIEKVQQFLAGIGEGAAAELAKADAALKQTTESAKDFGEGAKEGGKGLEVLNTAMTSFSAIAGGLNPNLGKLANILASFTSKALPTAAITGLAAGFLLLSKRAADTASEIRRMAVINGFTVETFSALKVAAEQNDASLSQLSIGLRTLNRQIAVAVTQGGAIQKQFIELGLTNQELNRFYGDSEAALEAVAKKITAAGTATEKTRLATLLFGRAGRELLPLLEEIATKGIGKLREEAEKAGLIISKETAQAAKEFNDNLTSLGQTVDAFITRTFLPFIKAFNDFVKEHPAVVNALGKIAVAMGALALAAGAVAAIKFTAATTGIASLVAGLTALVGLGPGLLILAGALTTIAALKGLIDIRSSETTRDIAPDVASARLKKAIADLKAYESNGRGATVAAQHLRDEIQKLTEVLEDYETTAKEGAREKLGDTYEKESDAAKQLRLQVRGLLADLEKTKALANIQIGLQLADQTGDVNVFLSEVRANLDKIRKAELIKIQIQFEQEVATSGTSKESLAAVDAARAARIAQLNEQLAQQERDIIQRTSQIALKAEEDRQASIEARGKADLAVAQARIEHEKQLFDLSIAQIPLLDEIVKKSQEIADKEADAVRERIKSLEQERNAILNKLALEQVPQVEIPKQTAKVQELNAEIQKQNTLLLKRNDFVSEATKRFAEIQQLSLQVNTTQAETQLDTLNDKLEKMQVAVDLGDKIPFSEFLEVAKQIDATQASIVASKIKEQELSIALLQIAKEQQIAATGLAGTFDAQIEAAKAALARLQNQAVISATALTDKKVQELEQKINDVASNTAKNFVDRLIQGLEDGKVDFQSFFRNLGKTLAADLLQEAIKQSLKPVLREQAEATGEKPADTLGGQFLQELKFVLSNVFGVEMAKGVQVGTEPLVTSASSLNTAAGAHVKAANLWESIAQSIGLKLSDSAQQNNAPIFDPLEELVQRVRSHQAEQAQNGGATTTPSGSVAARMNGFDVNSLLPSGMDLITGIGAVATGGGGGAIGALTQVQGGLSILKGGLEAYEQIRKLLEASEAAQSLGGLSGGLSAGSSVAGTLGAASSGGGFLGGIGDFFSGIMSIFGFAKGGMVGGMMPNQLGNAVSAGHIRKFRSGDMIRGATLGVIGEEGPEIVARMKPAGAHDDHGERGGDVQQNIYLVDQRRPNLGPNDVELIIADSVDRGRVVEKSVRNVLKRNKRG